MKTDRMTLLVTPNEKAELAARASALGISASELVRRAVQSYDPEFDEAALQELVDELADAVARTEVKLEATLAKVAAYEEVLADKESLRAAARAELEASGVAWPFDSPRKGKTSRATA
jgi:hypothetical protein